MVPINGASRSAQAWIPWLGGAIILLVSFPSMLDGLDFFIAEDLEDGFRNEHSVVTWLLPGFVTVSTITFILGWGWSWAMQRLARLPRSGSVLKITAIGTVCFGLPMGLIGGTLVGAIDGLVIFLITWLARDASDPGYWIMTLFLILIISVVHGILIGLTIGPTLGGLITWLTRRPTREQPPPLVLA